MCLLNSGGPEDTTFTKNVVNCFLKGAKTPTKRSVVVLNFCWSEMTAGLPLRKDHATLPNICAVNHHPNLPQMEVWPITTVLFSGGKVSNQNSKRLFDTGSELTQMFGELKLHCEWIMGERSHRIMVVLAHVNVSGWPMNPLPGYFLRFGMDN